ncbi:MAG: hypothetical protein OEV72_04565 [Thermoleophilia bacterium]|nr:hypothetical protein [Thermoleophilia bacterium]
MPSARSSTPSARSLAASALEERRSEVVLAAGLDRSCVDGDAGAQLADLAPVLGLECALDGDCRGDGVGRAGEGAVDGVSDRLEDDAGGVLDSRLQELVVEGERRSGGRSMVLQHLRAALDVAEQEGDDTRRQTGADLGHAPGERLIGQIASPRGRASHATPLSSCTRIPREAET